MGAVTGVFLIGYAVARIFVEFYRQPDPQIGYLALGWVTLGQVLSLPMFLLGLVLISWAYLRGREGGISGSDRKLQDP